jgi:PAS domain S-box-containing protein
MPSLDPAFGLDPATAIPVLEHLAQLHQGVLLAAPDGSIVWASPALVSSFSVGEGTHWRELFAEEKRAEELWTALRDEGRIANQPAEIEAGDGRRVLVEFTAVRLACGSDPGPVVALVRPESALGRSNGGVAHPLRESLDAFLRGAPEAAVVVDTSGFIVYANPALEQLLGHRPESVVDQPISLYLHHRRDVDRIAAALHAGERAQVDDVEVLCRGGKALRVAVTASALRLADGSEAGSVAWLRRATPEATRRQELERQNAELEHTLRAVAHDLRSPLVALLGFSRLLHDDFAELLGEKGLRFLHRIEQAGRTMESLIQHLLEVSRIGQCEPRKTLVDPRDVLHRITSELKPRLERSGTRLQWAPEAPLIHCEWTHLYQVLSNLVGNALEHMGPAPEPSVTVEFASDEREHRVSVRDNGRGIALEHHERIFEIFQSFQSVGSQERRGTGVGLAIVKKIAETYGGRAWVESRPGEGATFHVTLPRAPEEASS